MEKFIKSAFLRLSFIAYASGIVGAWLSGMFDLTPPPEGYGFYGNYVDGAIYSMTFTSIGLVLYWAFHLFTGDIFQNWDFITNKTSRLSWIICWPLALSYVMSVGLGV